jgi:hypothetical protein
VLAPLSVTAITLSYAGSPLPDAIAESDEQLLEQLQKAAFNYFVEHADATTGLVADTSRKGSPASIAVVGFALSCYPIGVERGWIARADAAAQTLKALRFFWNSPQGAEADVTGYKGFYYHFLDMRTGRRVWQCELSLIDTTLLLAGMLTAAAYFTAPAAEEPKSARWPRSSTAGSTGGGRRTATTR